MRIAICGSMQFGKEMLQIRDELELAGHHASPPKDTELYVSGERSAEGKEDKVRDDVFKYYWSKIENSDAILVVNITKKSIENYIGGNALIEMAYAYVLDKKIFLLNPIPDMSYRDEIEAMNPIVLNSDLSSI